MNQSNDPTVIFYYNLSFYAVHKNIEQNLLRLWTYVFSGSLRILETNELVPKFDNLHTHLLSTRQFDDDKFPWLPTALR